MARRPRSDKADRVEAIFADFDLLPIKDARFVVRAIRIALAVKERNQALAEAPASQLTIPILSESKIAADLGGGVMEDITSIPAVIQGEQQ